MKADPRSTLYYNQFEYAISWNQAEISCVQSLNQKKMLHSIKLRKEYEQAYHSWSPVSRPLHWVSPDSVTRYTEECCNNLESVRALLAAEPEPKKLVFNRDYVAVYTNDLGLRDRVVANCPWVTAMLVRRAELLIPVDTVLLKNPVHLYRTYLRSRVINKQQRESLSRWVDTQQPDITVSKSLKNFLSPVQRGFSHLRSNMVESYYYIEHDSLQYETMMSLVCPGLVRKTMSVMKKQ